MGNLLEVRNLSVSFFTYESTVQAVRDISFDLAPGETTALVGESGCGKSVTSKSIMGLIKKPGKILEGSRIYFKGQCITDFTIKEWERFRGKNCSIIFQDALASLNPTMKIGRQIIEVLNNHDTGLSRDEKVKKAVEMLAMTGIADAAGCLEKYPHELSGGMRQRVMIAMALIGRPELLIADEPTTSLDVTVQAQILEQMKQLQQKLNMAILLVTHDLGIVADAANKIIIMYAGRIVEQGPAREIFYHPVHPYTKALLDSVPRIDRDRTKRLRAIEGNIPDMANPPKGCAFCGRCPEAMNICEEHAPVLRQIEGPHAAACWLNELHTIHGGTDA